MKFLPNIIKFALVSALTTFVGKKLNKKKCKQICQKKIKPDFDQIQSWKDDGGRSGLWGDNGDTYFE